MWANRHSLNDTVALYMLVCRWSSCSTCFVFQFTNVALLNSILTLPWAHAIQRTERIFSVFEPFNCLTKSVKGELRACAMRATFMVTGSLPRSAKKAMSRNYRRIKSFLCKKYFVVLLRFLSHFYLNERIKMNWWNYQCTACCYLQHAVLRRNVK